MAIAVPKYLREIAEVTGSKEEKLTVKISCPCGCRKFLILKNVPKKVILSKIDAARIRETRKWEDNFVAELSQKYGCNYGIEWNSEGCDGYHEIRVYKQEDLLNKKKDAKPLEYLRIKNGQIPLSYNEISGLMSHNDYTVIFKSVCEDCGKEYLLFDSRIHGNDAAEDKPQTLEEYKFKQKKTGGSDAPAEIIISLKNFWDFDDIASNGNERLTADDYSEMFGYIQIKAIITGGKTVTVYSEDLG